MKFEQDLVVIAIAAGVVSCTSVADRQVVKILLVASQQNTGQIGQATLAADGEETSISILISWVSSETTRPLHMYSCIYRGTCAKKQIVAPAFEMNRRVLTVKHNTSVAGRLREGQTSPLAHCVLGIATLCCVPEPN